MPPKDKRRGPPAFAGNPHQNNDVSHRNLEDKLDQVLNMLSCVLQKETEIFEAVLKLISPPIPQLPAAKVAINLGSPAAKPEGEANG